jgi:hypothetical protein
MNSYPVYPTKSKVCSGVETEEFQSKQIASWAGTKTQDELEGLCVVGRG